MSKKPTGKKGNPNPVITEEFIANQIKAAGEKFTDQPLARKQLQVRLPQDVQDAIDNLPKSDRLTWVRRVLSEAARDELIIQQ